jgi:predicted HicB family RNase H-like nuclease
MMAMKMKIKHPGGRPPTGRGKLIKAIISAALDAALRAEAKRQGVSISKVIQQALKSFLKIS